MCSDEEELSVVRGLDKDGLFFGLVLLCDILFPSEPEGKG
jgi:hypothetical protein